MQTKNKSGFTIIELIIIMSLLAVLVLLAQARYVKITYNAKRNAFETNHKLLITAINSYIADNQGEMPKNFSDIFQYVVSAGDPNATNLNGNPIGSTYSLYETINAVGKKVIVLESKLKFETKPDYVITFTVGVD